jgi:hypothetical protein
MACFRVRGFTYLWVLMTVAFMGLGLGLASDVYRTALRREQEAELLAIGRQFQRALGSYYNLPTEVGGGEYPHSLEDLLADHRGAVVRRHLRKVFTDPVTGQATWGLVMVGGRIVGIHSLSEAATIKRAHFGPDAEHLTGMTRYSEWVFLYPSKASLWRATALPKLESAQAAPAR